MSGGAVTEVEIATHGAAEGNAVGSSVWTSHRLPPAGANNIEDMLKRHISDGIVYGSVPLYSPREQNATMHVGGDRGVRVWLNGNFDLRTSQTPGDRQLYRLFSCHASAGKKCPC